MQAHEYAALLPYAQTEHQRACVEALVEHGSQRKAAKALGCARRNLEKALSRVKRTAALAGYSPEHDYTHPVPPGFSARGVSTYYDADGKVKGQWVKSKADGEAREQLLLEAVREVAEGLKGKCPKIKAPRKRETSEDLLSLYAFGDMHFGLYCWGEEVGADFDIKIAERDMLAVADELVRQSKPSHTGILLNLGDAMHGDDFSNSTPKSGHVLDVDTRWSRVLTVLIRTLIHCTQRMLEKHKRVEVVNLPGNHDPTSSMMLSVAMSLYFENEPRVHVDTSPNKFRYRRHGKTLLGFTHGDNRMHKHLDAIMARDVPEDWGQSLWRYVHIGHVHHDSVRELHACKVESHRTLAPADAYAHNAGYRSGRDAKVITYSAEHGEIGRAIVSLSRVGLDPNA